MADANQAVMDSFEDLEDIFDGNSGDFPGSDMQRLENTHLKAGYREGISDGQEDSLQIGFNEGFVDAAYQYMPSSRLRGCISALMVYMNAEGGPIENETCTEKLKHFLTALKELEAKEPDIDRTNLQKKYEKEEKPMENVDKVQDIESAIAMMDSFNIDVDMSNENEEVCNSSCKKPSCCKENLIETMPIKKPFSNDKQSSCECDKKSCNAEDVVSTQEAICTSVEQVSVIKPHKNQVLRQLFGFDSICKNLETALESSVISNDVIQRLKTLINYTK